jgi:hypothetical protein
VGTSCISLRRIHSLLECYRLGPDAQGFAYSATTPQNQTHESGLQLRVKLSTSHPNIPFKTGELIEGTIIISKPDALPSSTTGSEEAVRVRSLTLRAYFESRTLFWHFQLASDKARAKYAPSVSQDHELTIGHEIHRGPVPQEDIEFSWEEGRSMVLYLDEVGADGKTPEVSLPFAFRLPERVRVNECNEYPDAPRDLCTVLRSPPPSFPNSPVASVQWVAEAILRLNTPSPSSSEPLVDVVDERLFRQSTPTTLVSRVVFPVLPSDAHTQELTKVPYFGRDLNEDPFGAMITWEGQADELDRLRERGYIGEWRTWTKFTRLNSRKLVSAEVTLIAEVCTSSRSSFDRLTPPKQALRPKTNHNPALQIFNPTNTSPPPLRTCRKRLKDSLQKISQRNLNNPLDSLSQTTCINARW